jgi:hypothetical protein
MSNPDRPTLSAKQLQERLNEANSVEARDRVKLLTILKEADDFRAIVLGMAFLEINVKDLLMQNVNHAPALEEMDLTYTGRLNLCEAIGLINSALVRVYKKLGNLRNSFAHSTVYNIGDNNEYKALMGAVETCGFQGPITQIADSLDAKRYSNASENLPIFTVEQQNVRATIFIMHALSLSNLNVGRK